MYTRCLYRNKNDNIELIGLNVRRKFKYLTTKKKAKFGIGMTRIGLLVPLGIWVKRVTLNFK